MPNEKQWARMFRAPCPNCEAKAIAKATLTSHLEIFVVGCEHELVGATVFAEAGLILDWSLWPAPDVDAFARGAAQRLSALQRKVEEAVVTQNGKVH